MTEELTMRFKDGFAGLVYVANGVALVLSDYEDMPTQRLTPLEQRLLITRLRFWADALESPGLLVIPAGINF